MTVSEIRVQYRTLKSRSGQKPSIFVVLFLIPLARDLLYRSVEG